ncbi:hypothetical protein GEM_4026 [Burkholderia cepacia GG4]|uniref:Uncharacterized protein n=1 Tax=Burkholderia cepacia GG4 TaxID=1009846 RepID=A0A9W3PBB8_BURCE|nr:hypothetical protein GEM_4026 [Burkholderia cepacia GG4]
MEIKYLLPSLRMPIPQGRLAADFLRACDPGRICATKAHLERLDAYCNDSLVARCDAMIYYRKPLRRFCLGAAKIYLKQLLELTRCVVAPVFRLDCCETHQKVSCQTERLVAKDKSFERVHEKTPPFSNPPEFIKWHLAEDSPYCFGAGVRCDMR